MVQEPARASSGRHARRPVGLLHRAGCPLHRRVPLRGGLGRRVRRVKKVAGRDFAEDTSLIYCMCLPAQAYRRRATRWILQVTQGRRQWGRADRLPREDERAAAGHAHHQHRAAGAAAEACREGHRERSRSQLFFKFGGNYRKLVNFGC